MVQRALRVVEAEQQRAHERARPLLVPAEAGDHAVRGARVLHLHHRALARLVRRALVLGHHAVEPGALEAVEPLGRDRALAAAGREVDAAAGARQRSLQPLPALGLRHATRRSSPSSASRSNATNDAGISAASFFTRDAAGAAASAERRSRARAAPAITISPSTTQRSGRLACKNGLELGEVAVERLQVAALDVQPVVVAEHDRAEAVPLRLEQPAVARRQLGRELREHRLDRRRDREARALRPSAHAGAARRDAALGRGPARVERVPGLVEVDDQRRVIRRRWACPCAPRGRSRPTPRGRPRGASRAGGRCACRSSCGSCRRGSPTRCSGRAPGAAGGRRRRAPSAGAARTPRARAARRACRRGRRAGPRRPRPRARR